MLFPLLYDKDEQYRAIANKVSSICSSDEFKSLRQELESLYQESELIDLDFLSFRDALFALLIQDEDSSPVKCQNY